MPLLLLSLLLLASQTTPSSTPSTLYERTLYERLDPTSIRQHLAFYQLYKETYWGKQALQDAWKLMTHHITSKTSELNFPENIDAFVELIQPSNQTKGQNQEFAIADDALLSIEEFASFLPNRQLKGYTIQEEAELDHLTDTELDLAHGLFLLQFGSSKEAEKKRRTYEAALDIMALQILVKTKLTASSEEKVRALNQFIFYDMGFRFPPHSIYEATIDEFTFLPSVIQSRRGVCLGVSTLYLALAQRLNLPLEIFTPPGHIFLSAQGINIETTLRGVHIPTEEYLTINTKALRQRSLKEVLGMVYMNLASIALGKSKWTEAVTAYERAIHFMPNDVLIMQLLAYSYLFVGKESAAKALLQQSLTIKEPEVISADSLALDLLAGKIDKECLIPIFKHTDENWASIEQKKILLQQVLAKYPQFRSGLFHLAICFLQLKKPEEAIACLEKLHAIDANDINCQYFLSTLYCERYHAPLALKHLAFAEKIARISNYSPRQLKELNVALAFDK